MLSVEEIKKLASLVKISLTDEEIEVLQKDVSSIVGYVSKLQELDLSAVKFDQENNQELAGSRSDWVIGTTLDEAKDLIKQAPHTKDNLISTKPIFNRS